MEVDNSWINNIIEDPFYQRLHESWDELKSEENIEGLKNLMAWVGESFLSSSKEINGFDYEDDYLELIEITRNVKDINKLEDIIRNHVEKTIIKINAENIL